MSEYISPLFWTLLIVLTLVIGGLVYYALRSKGDVFAKLTHGLTSLELQAKHRPPSKRNR